VRPLPRAVLLLLVAGAAFLATSSAIRRLVPWPGGFDIREKLDAYARVRDDVDVLYFGSSYVYRSFVPAVVDRELAARDVDVTSFNFGIGGMDAFETDHLMREVLADAPPGLSWVFYEPRPWFGRIADSPNAFTERSVRWHTWRATREALRSVWIAVDPPARKLDDAWTHLRLFARRVGNYGLGRTTVTHLLGLEAPSDLVDVFVRDRGYLPLDDLTEERFVLRRKALLADPADYQADVATMDARNQSRVDLARVNVEAFVDQEDAIRAAGAHPVAVLPPGLLASPVVTELRRAEVLEDVVPLNSPRRYPELYRLDRRYDRNHLNRQGAVEFSRLFAELVADRMREGD